MEWPTCGTYGGGLLLTLHVCGGDMQQGEKGNRKEQGGVIMIIMIRC